MRRSIRNKKIKKYAKFLKNDFDWDFAFLLELERFKLRNMLKYFSKDGISKGNDLIIRDLRICISLIGYILEEEKYIENIGYVNIKNVYRFYNNSSIINYVIKNVSTDVYAKSSYKSDKALYLYNKIRTYRLKFWWD